MSVCFCLVDVESPRVAVPLLLTANDEIRLKRRLPARVAGHALSGFDSVFLSIILHGRRHLRRYLLVVWF